MLIDVPESGQPPQQQGYGDPLPMSQSGPADIQGYQRELERAIQEKGLHRYYSPGIQGARNLPMIAQRAAESVDRLCQAWRIQREIAHDIVRLALYDIGINVDDSGSESFEESGERIKDLQLLLQRAAFAATLFDDDGVDIRFMDKDLPIQGITPRVIPFGKGTEISKDTAKFRYDNVLEGTLLGSQHLALVDSGAQNFISESFLNRCGREFDTSRSRVIRRADGSTFKTNGLVQLAWKFKEERKQHMVTFNVVADQFCQYAITLGGVFMQKTNMLRSLASKVLRIPRKCSIPRVRLQGGGSLGMRGFCDGREVFAMPDTASDVPVMSLEYARRLGKTIDYGAETSIPLLLPGGHLAHTLGMVRGVEWRFGESDVHNVDFYIMDGLPVDLLLDDDFLGRTQAFEKYSHLLTQVMESEEEDDYDDFDPGVLLTIQRLKEEHPSIINAALADIDSKMDSLSSQLTAINESTLTMEARTAKIDELSEEYRRLAQRRRQLELPVPKISTAAAESNSSDIQVKTPRFNWRRILRKPVPVKSSAHAPNQVLPGSLTNT